LIKITILGNIEVMKINIKKLANPIILSLLALVFFVGTASFNYLTQEKDYVKWTSPDETANYFFSKKLAEEGALAYFDEAAVVGGNMVMPRSLRSDFGWVKPVSFLGIIITYGFLGSLFGSAVIPFLTPFFGALGIVFFYLLIDRIFRNKRIALISAFLLASFPVYIYYTVRSMFHNILFIVFCLMAFYFLSLAMGNKRTLGAWEEIKAKFLTVKINKERLWQLFWSFIAGIFAGLAIITRTSELIWLIPAVGLTWLFYARRLGLIKPLLFLTGIFLAFTPIIYWNNVLYNNSWRGGYNEMNRSLEEISVAGNQLVQGTMSGQLAVYKDYARTLFNNIFYFGFDKDQSIMMFERYVLEMFPLLVLIGYAGIVILLIQNFKKFQKKYLVYFLFWVVSGAILVFYYGSWLFNDNPNPKSFTIGNSYTRYWLPIYLMLLPLVSLVIFKVTNTLCLVNHKLFSRWPKIAAAGLQIAAVGGISFIGLMFVLFGSEEGLAYLYYNNLAEKKVAQKVFSLTDDKGIIITQYYDKFFFPERRIIMGRLPNEEILKAAQELVKYYPVYYYNFYLKPEDVNYLNERKLIDYNLQLKLIIKTNSKFGLYQLENSLNQEAIID